MAITIIPAPTAIPEQTNNDGKYLTTDGSAASWGAVTSDSVPSVFLLMGA